MRKELSTSELMLTLYNLYRLSVTESAGSIRWAGRRFTERQFREFMRREMLPGNVIQLG